MVMLMRKIQIYKYLSGFLLLISIILFNLWNITKSSCQKENTLSKEINEKRIASLMTSNIVDIRKIKLSSGENIVTRERKDDLLKETTLAILLSEFKCNKCQEKELKRLDSLTEKMDENGINVIGITTKAKKYTVAIQRKILKLDFPIYWVDDEIFNDISIADEYPQIIYVGNNIIQSGFIPVPMDNEFSEMFYSELLKKTNWKIQIK